MLVQRIEYNASIQRDEARRLSDCVLPKFARLYRKVSHQGLRKLKEQLLLAKDKRYNTRKPCSGAFSIKFRLPCKHTLHRQLNKPRQLVINPKDVY